MAKEKSSRNKTIISDSPEVQKELKKILKTSDVKEGDLTSNLNKIFNGKLEEVLPLLPAESVDLIVTDPPYNLSKVYNGTKFNKRGAETYKELVDA
jgi:site-specific DNA-methyltransferase (adenine-specific)